jgi:hypothetical protein
MKKTCSVLATLGILGYKRNKFFSLDARTRYGIIVKRKRLEG